MKPKTKFVAYIACGAGLVIFSVLNYFFQPRTRLALPNLIGQLAFAAFLFYLAKRLNDE